MPDLRPDTYLKNAAAAAKHARRVRRHHARRTDKRSPQRAADIGIALDRLREAMVPLRSLIGSFPYGPTTPAAEENRREIRSASEALQRERRKLWKMLPKREEPQDA